MTFQFSTPDPRSAILLSESADVQVYGFKAACDARAALITAVDCVGMRLANVDATPNASSLFRLEGARSNKVLLQADGTGNFTHDIEYADGTSKSALLHTGR